MYHNTGMKASEAIVKLQELIDEHGDLQVFLPSCEWPDHPLKKKNILEREI